MQVPDFERIFEALPSAHMVLDRNLNYVAANPAYERATLRVYDDLKGRNIFDLFPNDGEGGKQLRASFERVIATGKADTIAYIPYDIPRPPEQGGGFDVRYWTASHSPVLDEKGQVAFIIQNSVDVTDLVRLREAAALPFPSRSGALLEHAREVEEAHRQLLAESEEFRNLFMQAPGFFCVLVGPDHVFAFANEAYYSLVGTRDLIGRSVREALPEIEGQGFLEMLDEVYQKGASRGASGAPVNLRGPDGQLRQAFVDFSYAPIRDRSGAITGIFCQGMDRTEGVLAERSQRLLLDEINHRVKNTLATVQSIASQTLRNARDLESARRDFEGRLVALSRTHNLLSNSSWTNASLSRLVEGELAAFDPERVMVVGDPIVLNPKASIALSMVFHELATNAARHGALAAPSGKVAVRWSVDEDTDALRLDWLEKGTEQSLPSEQESGLGGRMIQRLLEGELAGEIERSSKPEGTRFTMTIPADSYREG